MLNPGAIGMLIAGCVIIYGTLAYFVYRAFGRGK
jgi:hypothetical protein